MKPENHAIRQLEKQLDGTSPEQREAIIRICAGLRECIANGKDEHALAAARRSLAKDMEEFDHLLNPKK